MNPVECSICLDPIEPGEAQAGHATHIYHKPCLEGWAGGEPEFSCPLCRRGLVWDEEALAIKEAYLTKIVASFFFAGGVAICYFDPSTHREEGASVMFGISGLLVLINHVRAVVKRWADSLGDAQGA
jgi:hypothetical protein